MNYNSPFYIPFYYYGLNQLPQLYKPLERSLELIKQAVQGEKTDELFYDYLISMAPSQEEKNIITTIRDDERKHNRFFREIYKFYTVQSILPPTNVDFEKPQSYIDGISKAKFGELDALERYRDIRAGIPDQYYRDMVFEILTDELKHAHKYDYILYLDLKDKNFNRQTKEFTLSELAQYNGTMGKPAYVAVNGVIYDLSNVPPWKGGTHFGLTAGKDLTTEFGSCHGLESILANLPKVGILKI